MGDIYSIPYGYRKMKKNFIGILLVALVVMHILDGWPDGIIGWVNIVLLIVCLVLNLLDMRKGE